MTEVYENAESEQAAIQRCMEDVVEWNERNVLPLDILEMTHEFVDRSSGTIRAECNGDEIAFTCEENDVELRLVVPDDTD
ncbi:hypothetical protein [Halomontanus rarus]|uniref:hypothetical protein n=1 Tax=Halomontanus rarus TaxID=3034020 RepID=UPI00307C4C5D